MIGEEGHAVPDKPIPPRTVTRRFCEACGRTGPFAYPSGRHYPGLDYDGPTLQGQGRQGMCPGPVVGLTYVLEEASARSGGPGSTGSVAEGPSTNARSDSPAIAALAELVRLKDGPRDEAYRRDKDRAWERAREVLSGSCAASDPRSE